MHYVTTVICKKNGSILLLIEIMRQLQQEISYSVYRYLEEIFIGGD